MWGAWGRVIENTKVRYSYSVQVQVSFRLHHGKQIQKMSASACSEGGVWGPLIFRDHQVDTDTCPVGGPVVFTTVNHLELKLHTADSEFLKNNSGNTLLRLYDA